MLRRRPRTPLRQASPTGTAALNPALRCVSVSGGQLGYMMHPERHYSLGVDVGGTFTDFVLLDEASGLISIGKVLTTPNDPSDAMLSGTEALLTSSKTEGSLLTRVVHGTTLVTNTIIERKGVRT